MKEKSHLPKSIDDIDTVSYFNEHTKVNIDQNIQFFQTHHLTDAYLL